MVRGLPLLVLSKRIIYHVPASTDIRSNGRCVGSQCTGSLIAGWRGSYRIAILRSTPANTSNCSSQSLSSFNKAALHHNCQ
jgi:hypothetical protein